MVDVFPKRYLGATKMSWSSAVVALVSFLLLFSQAVFGRLRVNDMSPASQTQTAPPDATAALPGQIIGRVYRADTGAPLADVIVTLESVRGQGETSQRTATDGGYQFVGVVPGLYRIAAYRTGLSVPSSVKTNRGFQINLVVRIA